MLITPLIAAICAILYLYLSYSVIVQRISKNISLGSGGDPKLEIAIRVHSNFAEYVPMALILLWFLETVSYGHTLAPILGGVLIASRIAHIVGLRNPQKFMALRKMGIMATFAVILITAGLLIWEYLPILGLST